MSAYHDLTGFKDTCDRLAKKMKADDEVMSRMTDERLAEIEKPITNWPNTFPEPTHDLLRALKAERAHVVDLEHERGHLYEILDCTDPAKDISPNIDLIACSIDMAVQRAEAEGTSSEMYRGSLKCLYRQRRYKGELFEKHALAERAETTESQLTTLRAGIQALLNDGALYTTVTVERVRLEALIKQSGDQG